MRIGRRYSRSAGTRSSAGPADGVTDWSGTDRTVSPGPGSDVAAGGGVVLDGGAATAGSGMPSTGTGPGGEGGAAPPRGRPAPASASSAPQRRNSCPTGTGRSPGRPSWAGVATPSHDKTAPGTTPANAWLAGWRCRARRRAVLKYTLVI